FDYSKELYGEPKTPLIDKKSTPLKLADQFNKILESVSHVDLGAPPEACILAETVAFEMEKAVKDMFADKAPPVFVVDELSANALAGATRIRIRRGACFSDRDVEQLIQHEAFIHVATALNGLDQPILKMLSVSTPDNTKTQEGLAVFAELITGCIDLDRMRRLADRVVAIQMAIDGADFIEVFRYFCERVGSEEQAFENARRVFRGGMVEGGAPFTKDVVYLDGLLRVHNFLRALVSVGRPDCLRLLFCGKLDLDDIPILGWMVNTGMCKPATYLPPWASDLRFLLSYLAYSSFLNTISFADEKEHYATLLKDVPKIS
ncbi:MAG: flavohemoglobin expression-modulating QEGLA motif protein, partial [Gammaproteobacteria bacterium]|nr:flavohemoglobin expression-modulating QEGLA motif protein [Gammaproteobacteria bacterium]